MKYCFLFIIVFCACQEKAQVIVDRAIEKHGGKKFENAFIEFDFRNRHYTADRNAGIFQYTREFQDSTGHIKDVLSNDGFVRYINDTIANIPQERKDAFTNSVNSVIYFALLPFGLNDAAVNKTYVGETAIKGKSYDMIRVSFDQLGGGKDHEDVFLYWINQQTNMLDYFAYTYATDGGGLRFREAVYPQTSEGITLQDYINYKPHDESIPLGELQDLFVGGKLEKLSDIKLENLRVKVR
jgi:hypothetical protein